MPNLSQAVPSPNDPRNRVELACGSRGIKSDEIRAVFQGALRGLMHVLSGDEPNSSRAISHLTNIFTNFIHARVPTALPAMRWDRGIAEEGVHGRLYAASALSELLGNDSLSLQERSLREQIIIPVVEALLANALSPSDAAKGEIEVFVKNGPAFFERLVTFERDAKRSSRNPNYTDDEVRQEFKTAKLATLGVLLMVEADMPARVATRVTESILKMQDSKLRARVVRYYDAMVVDKMSVSRVGHARMPEPLGRPALIGAVKHDLGDFPHDIVGKESTEHQFKISLPRSRHLWTYFGQRIGSLASLKNPETRDQRLAAYMVSFPEFLASRKFFDGEEIHFRQINLENRPAVEYRLFYRNTYGADSGPGPQGSAVAEEAIRETGKVFRLLAAARQGINVRKGYARNLESGKWLLEEIAEDLGGQAQRFKVADIDEYPGPGVRLSGLRIRNALDLSTPQSRRAYLKIHPWIGASLRAGHEVDYIKMRGFVAITRSLERAASPVSKAWDRFGSLQVCRTALEVKNVPVARPAWTDPAMLNPYEERRTVPTNVKHRAFFKEPYAAVWFNDHFHNDRLPEVRMWLVPERVLHRKFIFAIENGVDPNKLDITPEGIAEDAAYLGLPIVNVGTSSVRWGSFSNAWPHGYGYGHEWEAEEGPNKGKAWGLTRYQDPFHVHRGLADVERYYEFLVEPVARNMARAKVEHDELRPVIKFFHDLHASFLTMEEAWAKDLTQLGEGPARLVIPGASNPPERQRDRNMLGDDGGPTNEERNEQAFTYERPRTRLLQRFLEMRNQMAVSAKPYEAKDYPVLELQYTQHFAQQMKTALIRGSDMALYLPEGRRIPLVPGGASSDTVYRTEAELTELMEAVWVEHFVNQFAPNNCPRIRLP